MTSDVCTASLEDLAVALSGCTACIGRGLFCLFVLCVCVLMFDRWLIRIHSPWVALAFNVLDFDPAGLLMLTPPRVASSLTISPS